MDSTSLGACSSGTSTIVSSLLRPSMQRTRPAEPMPLEPVAILPGHAGAFPVGGTGFEIRLPIFEGPLQLLLHLIESRQLDVLSVPLAEVADAYLEHLARN